MSLTTSRVPALAGRSLPKPRSHLAAAVLATHLIGPTVAKLTLGWAQRPGHLPHRTRWCSPRKFAPLGAAPRSSSGDSGTATPTWTPAGAGAVPLEGSSTEFNHSRVDDAFGGRHG
jgi:hypothetical protein